MRMTLTILIVLLGIHRNLISVWEWIKSFCLLLNISWSVQKVRPAKIYKEILHSNLLILRLTILIRATELKPL